MSAIAVAEPETESTVLTVGEEKMMAGLEARGGEELNWLLLELHLEVLHMLSR